MQDLPGIGETEGWTYSKRTEADSNDKYPGTRKADVFKMILDKINHYLFSSIQFNLSSTLQ